MNNIKEGPPIENRKLIFDYISDNPGSHLRKIARDLNVRLGTLRYHLDYLEKKGLIVSQKQNNLKMYFVSGKLKPQEKTLTQLLQQKHFRDIILALIESPDLTFSQIAEKVSMSPSATSKYINILRDKEILSYKKIGREKKYHINDEKSIVELLRTYKNFMANMSYEIRMPMNAIMGMTSLLLNENMTSEQKDFVETIKISADALMAIINDILDFSKIDREKTGLEIQTFSLRNCIEEALESVAAKAAIKRLDLAYLMDKVSPDIIIGDPYRLRQILVALMDNAIKFTERGEVVVSVSSSYLDPLYEIYFQIRNTGSGIPPDKIGRLLESSSAVDDSSTKTNEAASGLSLCKRLVELMSGRIWVENKADEGSTVHFTILTKHVQSIRPLTGIQLRLEGKRILIVESNVTIRDILSSQALEWGMISIATGSGEEALRLVQVESPFDIVLLDVNMSARAGLPLDGEMRRTDKTPPLVALSLVGQRVKPGNFVGSLTKPIKQHDFYNCLMGLFSGQAVSSFDQKPAEEDARLCSKRVLLAEDNMSNQKVILMMLKRLGYEADAVADGKEVLSALERRQYDAVLMDVRMPEMDGLEATRMIRQRWGNKPKIIAVTAYALRGDMKKCLEAGMDYYISKPIRIEELAQALSKIYVSSR
ncbi:Methanogenesis regulatory histidine kinase FilI [uncultured archaeon]|nr:Methanogenesis regulatory histidine kinase FilI [uncultured archaeon]